MDFARTRFALAVVPVLAVVALTLGLRVGASDDYEAAVVMAASPGKSASSLVWQVMTLRDERSVEETIAEPIHVEVWTGERKVQLDTATNADGISEIAFDLGPMHDGEAVHLRITNGKGITLAEGTTAMQTHRSLSVNKQRVPPSRRDGRIAMDLQIRAGRLAPGHEGTAWLHFTDAANGASLSDVAVSLTPELGLVSRSEGFSQECPGFAKIDLTPSAHVIGLGIEARSSVGSGAWFGALPVAAGALVIEVPDRTDEGPLTFDVVAPGAQSVAYVEVDDEVGRAFAKAISLPSASELGSSRIEPRAHVITPPLTRGKYWVVVSGEPRGAITMSGATLAWPVRIGPDEPCIAAQDAGDVPSGFVRWEAVDGRVQANRERALKRNKGMSLALGSLVIAAILETMLILLWARRTRVDMLALANEADAPSLKPSRRLGTYDVVIALLFLALGLGLLATFVTSRF